MNMLGRQLESVRIINWLKQQQQKKNGALDNSPTHYHRPVVVGYDMPDELAAMFEKSSGEADTFAWHSNGDDMASSVNVVEPGTEFGADNNVTGYSCPWVNLFSSKNINCQVAVKETAAMEVNEVVVLDNESDDEDWFFIGDFESFADDDSSGQRKASLPLVEDCNNEERTEVAAMESLACKSTTEEKNKKLGNIRGGQIKCPNNNRRDSETESLSSSDKKRRQKIHDKLQCLRNMIPWSSNKKSKSKTDLLYLKYHENQYLKSPPAAAIDANFTTETERLLAFAAPWGSSSTSSLSIPAEQYVHGQSSSFLCSGTSHYLGILRH